MKCKECDNLTQRYPWDEILNLDNKPYFICRASGQEVRPENKCEIRELE